MQAQGTPVAALSTRPKPLPHLHWILSSFENLKRDRSYGAENYPLALSTTQMRAYFEAYDIGVYCSFPDFAAKIRYIDSVYLNLLETKYAAARAAKASKGGSAAIPKNPKKR